MIRLFAFAALALALLPAPTRAQERELDCLVEPTRSVVVSAPVIGVVSEMLVDRGDRVEQGQVLARLEASVEEAEVAMARVQASSQGQLKAGEARLGFENRRLERKRQLLAESVASDHEVDEVESARAVAEADLQLAREGRSLAQAQLKRARAALARRTVKSPVPGVVVEILRDPGEYADPPQLLEVAQIDPLRVEVFAPVALWGTLEVGMTGRVTLEVAPAAPREAKISVVDRVVDAASGTFGVRLELPNPDLALPAGLKCRVAF